MALKSLPYSLLLPLFCPALTRARKGFLAVGGLESIFALVPSWISKISKNVWRVFLQWFNPWFQKRFGEPRLCRAVEASTQLLVLQHSSSSKAIVDDGDDEDEDDGGNDDHFHYHGDCDPPRQMLTPSVNLLGGTPLACYKVGTCWPWKYFHYCTENIFWKSGLLWLADWEWMGDGAKHFVQQNLSFQSYSWWEPSSFSSTSSFPKSSLGDDQLLLMGGRASPNTSEILQVRTLSLCYIDPVFWIARISKIGEEAQESFNLSPGRNSHCSIKVRVLSMWPQPVKKCSGILQSGNITRIRWVRLPKKR